jgi:chlorite dismutase
MSRPLSNSEPVESSLTPEEGWHCTHIYYQFERAVLANMSPALLDEGAQQLLVVLDPQGGQAPERIQTSIVSGHKADFGLMLMDPDPLRIDAVHQRLLASPLGPALSSTYSFVSMTEISEYVPSVEQYSQRLVAEGEPEGSPAFQAKVAAYTKREPMMRRQRLTPDFPDWRATCFYPMNKKRATGENWFYLPFEERTALMAEHAKTGMSFGGKVSQLITVAVGFDDWEWGVTLWARNPEFLKDIVYRMRFDEASARYAEFGPFYTSYITTPAEMLQHCRISDRV